MKVASSNAPAAPEWNSSATVGRSDGAATTFRSFDLTSQAGVLKVGANVLAVQCLNENPASNDLLFLPELLVSTGPVTSGVSPTAMVHDGSPVQFERSARLKARAFGGDEWSALTTALYTVGSPAAPGQLVISELMYHPPKDNPTEFIEVTNISGQHLALAGVAFTGGIDFSFPETAILAPGQRALVVQDLTAFQIAYGSGLPVLGEFENGTRLANGGERIVLTAADGATLQDFVYGDLPPWPESPDGPGASLVLIAPETDPDHADPLNWRASVEQGGNPDASDTIAFPGNEADDLLNYALAEPSEIKVSLDGESLFVSFRQFLAADQARVRLEFSDDLLQWTPANPENLHSRHNHFDGTVTTIYELSRGTSAPPHRFARVRVAFR